MRLSKTIKVLVVDDSLFFREVLARGLRSDPNIQVVGTAGDPFEARDKILQYQPDVMTCDVEMPRMNGIEFLSRLLPQYPLPVIVVSTVSEAVFDALKVGAVDFVTKPDVRSVKSVEKFILDLINKVKIAANAQVKQPENLGISKTLIKNNYNPNKVIAIGASTGGTEAIFNLLKSLPHNIPGIVIVQHIPPVFSRMFAERLNNSILLEVKEAETGDYIQQGKVLIAPGDRHVVVRKAANKYKIECFKGDKVNGHCPSVDVLFESMTTTVGENSIGIILTGMGYDGAKGLLSLRKIGARTIGQDEESSVVYGMPKVAYNIGAVEKQVPLRKVAEVLFTMLN